MWFSPQGYLSALISWQSEGWEKKKETAIFFMTYSLQSHITTWTLFIKNEPLSLPYTLGEENQASTLNESDIKKFLDKIYNYHWLAQRLTQNQLHWFIWAWIRCNRLTKVAVGHSWHIFLKTVSFQGFSLTLPGSLTKIEYILSKCSFVFWLYGSRPGQGVSQTEGNGARLKTTSTELHFTDLETSYLDAIHSSSLFCLLGKFCFHSWETHDLNPK